MYTQVTCPNCHTPYTAEIHQVIDSDETPQLKQQLLAGQLNIAVCPNCGAGGQMMTPMLFHDAEHEMFVIFMPQELNMGQVEREQFIGQMARQVMDGMPPEKRRAYMLQPQTVLTMQSFMEKVLETGRQGCSRLFTQGADERN
ncbi:MAG: CpXC domain-containing protein [Anaerolineae bacterium]